MPNIGLLNEKPLHAALKQWYARPGDRFEVPVDGFVAIKSGGGESDLGPEWVRIVLFRSTWPDPDLAHWARRAYAFARGQ